jgi:hypothetical protein
MLAVQPQGELKSMSRPNYHQQVKKQKERARKARQDEKQQRRSAARVNVAGEASGDGTATESETPHEPVSGTTP